MTASGGPVLSFRTGRRTRAWHQLRRTIEYARSLTPAQARELFRAIDDAIERESGSAE